MSAAVWLSAADGLIVGSAILLITLAGQRRLAPLRTIAAPLACWFTAVIIGLCAHTPNAQANQDVLALVGGPLILCASALPWGRWRSRTLQGLLIGAAGIALFAIWQYFVILPDAAAHAAPSTASSVSRTLYEVAMRRRPFGTFSLPILLAAYLVIVIPLAMDAMMRACSKPIWWRWMSWGALATTVIALTLTRSIGALISLLLACAIVWGRRQPSRSSTLLVVAVGALCVGVVLHGRADVWQYGNRHHPIHNRLVYWDAALHLITTHPLIGIGPGRFGEQYRDVTAAPQAGTRHAHNTYLQIWAEWGLLGVIGWCWLLGAVLRRTASQSPWLAVALWALPLCNLFDFSFYIPQVCMLWWYLAGWSFRVRQQRRRADSA